MKREWGRLFKSFHFAMQGLLHAIKNERNLQIHLIISCFVILMAFLLNFGAAKWTILLLTIGIVVSLELVNTAIEATVNLFTKEFHPQAKIAKDVAAAAVFFFSIIAVLIGLFLFIPPILELLK
jgi:undecaprenol kinase